jgi:hypothetical protein
LIVVYYNRVIDQFFFSVIQDTLNNDIRFNFDPDALLDTNVLQIDIFTGNTPGGSYDFLLVVDDNQNFSEPVPLTIVIVDDPLAAQLIAPPNGAQGIGRFPDFEWNNSADSAIWQLSLNEDFTDLIYSLEVNNLTDFSFVDQLTPLTQFYWRVLIYTACGEISSEVWSFTTGDWVNHREIFEDRVLIHPNPMGEALFVRITGTPPESGELMILDELGRIVYKSAVHAVLENGRINTSNLVSGTYVLKIATSDSIFTTKLIKH